MKKNTPKTTSPLTAIFSRKTLIGLLLGVIIGATSMFFVNQKQSQSSKKHPYKELREGGYKYINPLLECDAYQSANVWKMTSLENEINRQITKFKDEKKATHISIYFRDLNNGPWLGINEHDYFTPASLLKLPLVMAVYKKAESNANFLQNKITFAAPFDNQFKANIGDKVKIELGQTYTVEQLIDYTMRHSDNNAQSILHWYLGPSFIDSVYIQLGVNLTKRDLNTDFITIKEYSSFFRILYNASFLDRYYSEKTLELLSGIEFNSGIPAKLPRDVKVSHKYGERGYLDAPLKQLHDCGIVYADNKPYLICIMTKGDDFNNLTEVIANLSEVVYNVSRK